MAAYDFYRPNARSTAWPMNLLSARDPRPECWRVYNLRLCETQLVPDWEGVLRNHAEAWLWFGWRTDDPRLLTVRGNPDAYGFSFENPYDAGSAAVGWAP